MLEYNRNVLQFVRKSRRRRKMIDSNKNIAIIQELPAERRLCYPARYERGYDYKWSR